MNDDDAAIRHQLAATDLGGVALHWRDLVTVPAEAARPRAEGSDVPFAKLGRYRAPEPARAGISDA